MYWVTSFNKGLEDVGNFIFYSVFNHFFIFTEP